MGSPRKQSEAARKASLVTAYFKAVEKQEAAEAALDKAHKRVVAAAGVTSAAKKACAEVNVSVGEAVEAE